MQQQQAWRPDSSSVAACDMWICGAAKQAIWFRIGEVQCMRMHQK